MYVLLTADVEKIDPPMMEGLDALVAVSEFLHVALAMACSLRLDMFIA